MWLNARAEFNIEAKVLQAFANPVRFVWDAARKRVGLKQNHTEAGAAE